MWVSDASAASTSILAFLSRHYGLKLCDWKHFYRKISSAALDHVFRVTSSLDSMMVGEPEIVAQACWSVTRPRGAAPVVQSD